MKHSDGNILVAWINGHIYGGITFIWVMGKPLAANTQSAPIKPVCHPSSDSIHIISAELNTDSVSRCRYCDTD